MKTLGINVHRVEVELSCCIGRPEVLMQAYAFDHDNIIMCSDNVTLKVYTDELIKTFELDTPRFADMCKNGMF